MALVLHVTRSYNFKISNQVAVGGCSELDGLGQETIHKIERWDQSKEAMLEEKEEKEK